MAVLTHTQMVAVINAGDVVLYNGRVYTQAGDLPDDATIQANSDQLPSGTTKLVDLGVVTTTALLAGPTTLYQPSSGELILVAPSPAGYVNSDAMHVRVLPNDGTLSAGDNVLLSPAGAAFANLIAGAVLPWVITADNPLVAALFTTTNTLPVLATAPARQASHTYQPDDLVMASGHLWSANHGGSAGAAGSGGAPAFASNFGGSVVDGAVTWTDEGAVPTAGVVHLYALVAKL